MASKGIVAEIKGGASKRGGDIQKTKSRGNFVEEIENLDEDIGVAAEAQQWWNEATHIVPHENGDYSENTKRNSANKKKKKIIANLKSLVTLGRAPSSAEEVVDKVVEKQVGIYVDKKTRSDELFNQANLRFQAAEPANCYTFEEVTRKWNVERMTVRIASKHFAEGGMRKCYQGGIILDNVYTSECVFKIFLKEVKPLTLFRETLTQVVSSSFADKFNLLVSEKLSKWPGAVKRLTIAFLPVSVVEFPGRRKKKSSQYATMEPFLKYGWSYKKLNDNFGRATSSREGMLGQAFSYYTFIKSKGFLIVCDIQGVDRIFTDPQIHSLDPTIFGAGNFGVEGINRFLQSFKYSPLCRNLGLPRPETLHSYFNSKVLRENRNLINNILNDLKNKDGQTDGSVQEEATEEDFDLEKINTEREQADVASAAEAIRRFSARRGTKGSMMELSNVEVSNEESQRKKSSILNKLANWRPGSPEFNELQDYTRRSTITILDELVLDQSVYDDV